MIGAPNAKSNALVVAIPPIDVGIIDSIKEVLWVIVDCARIVQLTTNDHDEKESLEVVAAPPVVLEAS